MTLGMAARGGLSSLVVKGRSDRNCPGFALDRRSDPREGVGARLGRTAETITNVFSIGPCDQCGNGPRMLARIGDSKSKGENDYRFASSITVLVRALYLPLAL